MDLALLVYGISLISKTEVILSCGVIFGGIASLLFATLISSWAFDGNEYSWDKDQNGQLKEKVVNMRNLQKRLLKISIWITSICIVFSIVVPSEKTAYLMVGAYATQKIAENDKVQETGEKVLKIINQKLDGLLAEEIKNKK